MRKHFVKWRNWIFFLFTWTIKIYNNSTLYFALLKSNRVVINLIFFFHLLLFCPNPIPFSFSSFVFELHDDCLHWIQTKRTKTWRHKAFIVTVDGSFVAFHSMRIRKKHVKKNHCLNQAVCGFLHTYSERHSYNVPILFTSSQKVFPHLFFITRIWNIRLFSILKFIGLRCSLLIVKKFSI